MNFKRKRPKHQRAGCLYCKPHKDNRGANSDKAKAMYLLRAEFAFRGATLNLVFGDDV